MKAIVKSQRRSGIVYLIVASTRGLLHAQYCTVCTVLHAQGHCAHDVSNGGTGTVAFAAALDVVSRTPKFESNFCSIT